MSLSFKGQHFIIRLRSGHHRVTLQTKHKLITLTLKVNSRCRIHLPNPSVVSIETRPYIYPFYLLLLFWTLPQKSEFPPSTGFIMCRFILWAFYWERTLKINLLFILDLKQMRDNWFTVSVWNRDIYELLHLQHKCHVLFKTSGLLVPISKHRLD